MDEDYKKITLARRSFHDSCEERDMTYGDTMLGRRCSEGEPRTISFNVFKSTQVYYKGGGIGGVQFRILEKYFPGKIAITCNPTV